MMQLQTQGKRTMKTNLDTTIHNPKSFKEEEKNVNLWGIRGNTPPNLSTIWNSYKPALHGTLIQYKFGGEVELL